MLLHLRSCLRFAPSKSIISSQIISRQSIREQFIPVRMLQVKQRRTNEKNYFEKVPVPAGYQLVYEISLSKIWYYSIYAGAYTTFSLGSFCVGYMFLGGEISAHLGELTPLESYMITLIIFAHSAVLTALIKKTPIRMYQNLQTKDHVMQTFPLNFFQKKMIYTLVPAGKDSVSLKEIIPGVHMYHINSINKSFAIDKKHFKTPLHYRYFMGQEIDEEGDDFEDTT
eukprot:TRINITY_DN3808_c0_g1_i1.p1 TRINITY_DN3808_c0_g1~~TRINITY_DN3808_c0_g1_i1.p1  ORF type:complete len:226 (-),score=12.95 TRINITY_DN3808_c0_g1_i1:136-813(-)